MSARTKARKRALDILFQADVRGDEPAAILAAEAKRAASEPSREASWLYAREIVDGVIDNRDAIDEQITTFAKDWSLARMPAVDRALLRIAVWEVLYNDEVPPGVAIDEAVELAKEFSTDESGSFVNGVLARIARASCTPRHEPDRLRSWVV
jgi:N utilization substance protein B